jgi:hypothetical protein
MLHNLISKSLCFSHPTCFEFPLNSSQLNFVEKFAGEGIRRKKIEEGCLLRRKPIDEEENQLLLHVAKGVVRLQTFPAAEVKNG